MKAKLKMISSYILIFVITIGIMLGLLTLSTSIPTSHIKKNMAESATYLTDKQMFFFANSWDYSSKIDRYADAILLNIAYSHDSEHPVKSAMSSSYYYTDYQNENYNLLEAVSLSEKPDYSTLKPYSRYWHGSLIIVRSLHIFLNVKQIYIVDTIILFILCVTLLFFAKKHLNHKIFCCILISMIMVSIWYVPMSLEYTWSFLIMLVASILSIVFYNRKKEHLFHIFFITGMAICFFDFLTTETITFLIPITLLLVMKYEDGSLDTLKKELIYIIKCGFLWVLGYALTWLSKWTLASIILGENVFHDAINQAGYRINGVTEEISGIKEMLLAVFYNLSCIFPFSLIEKNGYVPVIISLAIILISLYIFKKRKTPKTLNLLLALIALIPIGRFILLANHSYIHYFFTYRALMASILCVCLIFAYNFDFEYLWKKGAVLWKRK